MLEHVRVTDFSLLRSADLPLGPGLTCISGESGSGKSLLFDAIAFACGGRTHRSLLAAGATTCAVELTLRLSSMRAAELGFPWKTGSNELSRRFSSSGRTQISVNGTHLRTANVQAAAAHLIEITGQFESATLFNPATHVELLDAFGGTAIARQRDGYSIQYAEYRELTSRLATLRAAEQNRTQEIEFLEFQVAELEKANVELGERAAVEIRLRMQQHGAAILRHSHTAVELLTGGDEAASAYDFAARAQRELGDAVRLLGTDDATTNLPAQAANLIEDALAQLQEAARISQALGDSVVFDPQAELTASSRLDELLRLERKYGKAADALPDLLEEYRRRLAVLTDETQSPEEIARQQQASWTKVSSEAAVLSKLRAKAATAMRKETGRYFEQLDFPRCELLIDISQAAEPGPAGLDNVELLITLNPGEPPRPLAQVASGGEASRLLLGLKAALADKLHFGTLLLDEIEAGLGGRTAQRVGEILQQLAADRQVLAISHLPVVVAHADNHLVVRKHISQGRTEAVIEPVSGTHRRIELARMLGGLGTPEELAVVDQLLAQVK